MRIAYDYFKLIRVNEMVHRRETIDGDFTGNATAQWNGPQQFELAWDSNRKEWCRYEQFTVTLPADEEGGTVHKYHHPPAASHQRGGKVKKKLYKTTIIIWSDFRGDSVSLEDLARDADSGGSYCSKSESCLIEEPTKDADWDGTEFFGDDVDPEYTEEPESSETCNE